MLTDAKNGSILDCCVAARKKKPTGMYDNVGVDFVVFFVPFFCNSSMLVIFHLVAVTRNICTGVVACGSWTAVTSRLN